MPKSRVRKKTKESRKATAPAPQPTAGPKRSPRWIAPAMLTCWLVGLIWIIVYYVAGTELPYMSDLGNWNLVVGMGLVGFGFIFATQWR